MATGSVTNNTDAGRDDDQPVQDVLFSLTRPRRTGRHESPKVTQHSPAVPANLPGGGVASPSDVTTGKGLNLLGAVVLVGVLLWMAN